MNAWSRVCCWVLMAAWLPLAQPVLAAGDSGAAAGQQGLRGHLASVDWLKANLARPDVVLIDASPAPLHRQQHIPGAILSTLFTFGPKDVPQDQFEAQLRAWGVNAGQHIVLYDQGGTYMATRLFWDLVHHGMPADRLLILDGGLAKWQALGGVVTKEATPKPVPGTIRLAALDQTVRVRLPEFLVATGDPLRHVLLEALEPSYFFGGAAFFNRGGHVPHATLMPSTDFFNADKTFRSPPEIQRMLDHLGIRREQQVHTYCGGGGAAAVPFFALKYLLDYPRVTLFQESQMGWLQDARELPVWTYASPHLLRDTAWLKAWGSPMLKAFGLSQLSIIDVRPAEVFKLGHVPLAVNLPAQLFIDQRQNPQALLALLGQAGVDPSHEVVVVSEGGITAQAALAHLVLEGLGQRQVSIFMDSIERWAELGHEVARPAPAAAASMPPEPSTTPSAAATAPPSTTPVRALVNARRTDHRIADANSPQGLYPRVFVASGPQLPATTPPGQLVHLPHARLLKPDGTPKPASELWNLIHQAGVPRYAQIVVLADSAGDAAVNQLIFRLMGFADVLVWAP